MTPADIKNILNKLIEKANEVEFRATEYEDFADAMIEYDVNNVTYYIFSRADYMIHINRNSRPIESIQCTSLEFSEIRCLMSKLRQLFKDKSCKELMDSLK